jgi:hypothetical protein
LNSSDDWATNLILDTDPDPAFNGSWYFLVQPATISPQLNRNLILNVGIIAKRVYRIETGQLAGSGCFLSYPEDDCSWVTRRGQVITREVAKYGKTLGNPTHPDFLDFSHVLVVPVTSATSSDDLRVPMQPADLVTLLRLRQRLANALTELTALQELSPDDLKVLAGLDLITMIHDQSLPSGVR